MLENFRDDRAYAKPIFWWEVSKMSLLVEPLQWGGRFFKIPIIYSRKLHCNWVLYGPESVATLLPFGPIEGQKWFDRISSQWESQKNRFALIYFGKIRFLPPCIWNIPFVSYSLWQFAGWATRKQFHCLQSIHENYFIAHRVYWWVH